MGDVPTPARASSAATSRWSTRLLDLRSADDLARWDALYRSVGTIPFQAPTWTTTWLDIYGASGEPWIVGVFDADDLVGVAPLHREAVAGRTAHRVVTIGSATGSGVLELPSFVIAPHDVRAITRAIVGHIVDRSHRWDWAQITLSPDTWFEPEWLPAGGQFISLTHTVRPTPIVRFGEEASVRGRNVKESLRRSRNRLKRDFGDDWRITTASTSAEISDALPRLVDLHAARSSMAGVKQHADVAAEGTDARFLEQAIRAAAPQGGSTIYEVVAGGRSIAALLVLNAPESTHFSISGLHESAWDYSAVTLLQGQAMDDAEAAGLTRTVPGTGVDVPKLRWGASVSIHHEFAVIGPRRRSRLAFAAYRNASSVAEILRESNRHRILSRADRKARGT